MQVEGLQPFTEVTRRWFSDSFAAPTPAQAGAWEAISSGKSALVVAPTGSGKTLAAFLWSIDRLSSAPAPDPKQRLRVLYISPLKALAVDVDRNLKSPLAGIRNVAVRLGLELSPISVAVRTGDTSQADRRRFVSAPTDILITTPESLFLMLTSQARETLRNIEAVIVDEVHALVPTKRGAHLALSLERLDALLEKPAQRIGLSATVRPLEEVAAFLGGRADVAIVNPPFEKEFDLSVEVPVEDMSEMGMEHAEITSGQSAAGDPAHKSIWPSIEARLVDLVRGHHSTIVFANSRRLSERICARMNELAGEEIARSHHGSVSKDQRLQIEEELKSGRLPAVVATSSLELGIDMGAVDLVVQIESPPSVAAGLQRIGRAGHQVGEVSRGVLMPKYRHDLIECSVVIERMKQGAIESMRYPRNPLDVLAQHVVAMVAMDDWVLDDLETVIRRAAPFFKMPSSALSGVLDMLSGFYPSDDFAELRARINWDRPTGVLTPRSSAQHLAVTSGGTIPDRGLYGVFLAGSGTVRVGELDEEMVYESRVTDVFALGASSWRIEEITHDRVIVTPAPGEPAKLPFWHGDALGRPLELGRAMGAFIRQIAASDEEAALRRLEDDGLDEFASKNLIAYLSDQLEETGHLPDDRTILVERFRDELGDWRLCIHSSFGAQVHSPWALAIQASFQNRLGVEVQTMHTDDGIVIRLPESHQSGAADAVTFDPEEIEGLVTAQVGTSAMFASRFRECAARALLLPKRRPDRRTPLWQQRQKSANLLQAAAGYGTFPIILETMRECLQDVFDLPGLKQLMSEIRSRKVRVIEVETAQPSPFASSLLFGYIGAFIYEGDAPLAERRAQALSLDSALLAELLGSAELRELIDPEAVEELELELQRLIPGRKIRDVDDAHDALSHLGATTSAGMIGRGAEPKWLAELEETRRAIRIRVAGEERWAAIEDAARFRDALGVPLPVGIPDAFLQPVADPMGDLVSRYARTHGPFEAGQAAKSLGLGSAVVSGALAKLAQTGKVVSGEFRRGGTGIEWCEAEVLRRLRRMSLARLRKEAEAVSPELLGRFLPAWQGVLSNRRGFDALTRAIEQLQGASIPAKSLERLVLPARVPGYSPSMLDQLMAAGEVLWAGTDAIGADDGWVSLYLLGDAELLLPFPKTEALTTAATQVLGALSSGGAMFFRQLASAASVNKDSDLLDALWELVWKGLVTNDTIAPLRALVRGRRRSGPIGPSRRTRGLRVPTLATQGPPAAAGRWSLLPKPSEDSTRRAHALAEQMLDRHGVLTRTAAAAEGSYGGFAAVYPVLKGLEERGLCRRGYFVEGLGGAQFAMPGAVDRLREIAANLHETSGALVLAAADPANPYGAAISWPERTGHRPGRKAGALVVLVDGALVIYVEKGGRTLLTFDDDEKFLQPAVDALALAVREGALGKLAVEKADGGAVTDTALGRAMEAAGFRQTSRGLRLRA